MGKVFFSKGKSGICEKVKKASGGLQVSKAIILQE